VDIGNVSFENGIEDFETYKFRSAPSRARRIAKQGDTIISTVRTYLKSIDYIDNFKSRFIFSTGFAVLTPNKNIYPKFLSSFVWSDAFTEQVRIHSKGISYPAINSTDLSNLSIAIPTYTEQLKIVEYIDNLHQKIGNSISNKNSEIEKLNEFKITLTNNAVTGKIKVI
jgi:type I restriction enzyme S subunit